MLSILGPAFASGCRLEPATASWKPALMCSIYWISEMLWKWDPDSQMNEFGMISRGQYTKDKCLAGLIYLAVQSSMKLCRVGPAFLPLPRTKYIRMGICSCDALFVLVRVQLRS